MKQRYRPEASRQSIAAFGTIHQSKQLHTLLETYLEDMRRSFPLIEYEIKEYMTRWEVHRDVELIRMLIARLMDWHKAWQPPKDLGGTVYKGFDFTFRTCLFSILPPSFASGFKALVSWALSPEDFPPTDSLTARTPIATVWQHCETLGFLGRYESVISSVGYERIERHVLETCEGNWSSPMLPELRVWMTNKVLPWLLAIYVRGAANTTEAQGLLAGVGSRFDYHLMKTLFELRTKEIFDIIIDYPDSTGALQDLREGLARTDQGAALVKTLRKANAKRLLHPGADTKLILTQYVSTIKCLRLVDPPGVLLFKVADPIRRYLRERPDTIRCIVASLVGDEDSGDSLLDDNEPIVPIQQPEVEDFTDATWVPEPIDAGPEFKANKPSDVLSTLVSIYDSKDFFVKELQVLLAQRLLAITDASDVARVDKERRNIEILKIRFGEAALQVCEVMLRDMADSKRIDSHVQSQRSSIVHPTIISHHFWPSLESSELALPGQFQDLQESYSHEFTVFKPDKKLKWIPNLGTVHLKIELEDRTLEVEVPPLEAAFIELFSQKDVWSLDELISAVGNVDRSSAVKALSTWANKGVIKEQGENSFILLERAEEGASDEDGLLSEELAPSAVPALPPVQTAQQHQAEQMRIHWKFIEGMLTNLRSLSLDRIHSMLKFAPNYDQAIEDLGVFMEAARREGLVVCRDGMWELNK
ncbi:hypothetical protein EST38_g4511 [Candolleomyces aberdarensis]|uniref:Anaphase-promoting complex subunit 2 n=1 Tax=Candolleomyces aberdarensis TaxID=2316362 RepID=A0A4Q2DQ74_9AGAR|nr:hypothetical protein EST38_g4511 [Candolleomyces aberdarensis]